MPTVNSTLNLDWLITATDIISDHQHRTYMQHYYRYGAPDHSDLPMDAQRFAVINSVEPGTVHGDAWDALIDEQDRRGRIIELEAPTIAGTVIMPMGCTEKINIAADGTETIKFRPHIDGRESRVEHRNPGAWSHPINLQYSSETVHETITNIISTNASSINMFDYKGFYLTIPRTSSSIARNAIFWKRPGRTKPHVLYLLDDAFGQCQTPSKAERHARLLQAVQEQRTSAAAGRPVHFSRRCDDTIMPIPASEHHRAQEYADIFVEVCRQANQPIQATKVLVGVARFKFDGYWFDLNAFPNNRHDVHPGGVGIDATRAKNITIKVRAVITGTTRKQVERSLGLVEWVAVLTPHIRALIITLRRAMYSVKLDTDPVPTGNPELVADMDRMLVHFEKPRMVPFYHLYKLTPPEIDLYTDASGDDAFGGWMNGMFYTEPLTEAQKLDPELVAAGDSDALSLCTAYLEVAALYLMVVAARRRLHNKIVRWTTDAQAAARAWTRQSSKHHATNRLLAIIGSHCTTHAILIEPRWIPREKNDIADALTHADILYYCSHRRVSPREQVRVPRFAVNKLAALQKR